MDAKLSPRPLPINTVSPPDILRWILTLSSSCHDHPSLCYPLLRTSHTITHNLCHNTPDPLLLSHVCLRWHNLILVLTLTMWASIFMLSLIDQQLCLLKLWLEHSQSCVLDILFDYCSDKGQGSFKEIVKLLVGDAAWCISFEFISHAQRNMPGTFRECDYIQPGSFKALKKLSVFVDMDDRTFLDDFAITFFASAFDLCICRLMEPQVLNLILRINPTWSLNLTLFAFGNNLSILPLISNSPLLTSLTLDFQSAKLTWHSQLWWLYPNCDTLSCIASKNPISCWIGSSSHSYAIYWQ